MKIEQGIIAVKVQYQRRLSVVLALICILSYGPTFRARGDDDGKVIDNLADSWTLSAVQQPVGNWRLKRGSADSRVEHLIDFDLFERALQGDPNLSVWTHGTSIFNSPAVSRKLVQAGDNVLFASPEADREDNEYMGAIYLVWEGSSEGSYLVQIDTANIGTDVKGGDGILVEVGISHGAGPLRTATTIEVPASSVPGADQPQRATEAFSLSGDDQLVVAVKPKKDGYGDRLVFNVKILSTD